MKLVVIDPSELIDRETTYIREKSMRAHTHTCICICRYLSQSMMLFNRWAIVMTVQSANSFRIVFWMSSSVSRSTAAVASSRTRTFVFRRRVLARQTSCRCPTLNSEQTFPVQSLIIITNDNIIKNFLIFNLLILCKHFKHSENCKFVGHFLSPTNILPYFTKHKTQSYPIFTLTQPPPTISTPAPFRLFGSPSLDSVLAPEWTKRPGNRGLDLISRWE